MSKVGRQFTHSDDTVLQAYKANGEDVEATAQVLGYNAGTVYTRLRRMGHPAQGRGGGFEKKYSDDQVREAWEQGEHNLQRAAQFLGSSIFAVKNRVTKLGLPDAPKPKPLLRIGGASLNVEWVVPERVHELRLAELTLRRLGIEPPEAMLKELAGVPELPPIVKRGSSEYVVALGEGRNLRITAG